MQPDPIVAILPATGYVRVAHIVGDPNAKPPIPALIPIGKSTWWKGVRENRYPQPLKLSPRVTVWRIEDIRQLIESTNAAK